MICPPDVMKKVNDTKLQLETPSWPYFKYN